MKIMKKLLITGGAGYIASHTNLECLAKGYDLVLVDNFCNSSFEAVRRMEELAERKVTFCEEDIRNQSAMERIFKFQGPFHGVIHFAALKAVGESVAKPLEYYENNIAGSLSLYKLMRKFGVKNIVFSSSATVYGDPETGMVNEEAPLRPSSPYGRTKAMMEQILLDAAAAENWNVMILRYFNPVGAHPSGRIGEDPEYPNNLLPFVTQVAAGIREKVVIFGNDWPTPDGTGVRDYIYVVDLAKAHVKALRCLEERPGIHVYNVGTGRGYSVLEVIQACEKACGHSIPYQIGPRRRGDVAVVTADPARAMEELGWRAEYSLEEMVSSAWKWQSLNPRGYRS